MIFLNGIVIGIFIALLAHKFYSSQVQISNSKINKVNIFKDNFNEKLKTFWVKQVKDSTRYKLVKDPIDSTNIVLKIQNRLEDTVNGGLRSEFYMYSKDSFGYKTNYGFKFLIPDDFFKKEEKSDWIIIHQWHDEPQPGFNCATQKSKTQPPIHLLIKPNTNGEYYLIFKTGLETGSLKEIKSIVWPEKLISNKWYQFSCEVLWSLYNNEGYTIPKLDDKYFVNNYSKIDSTYSHKIYTRNMYNIIPNYFKFGLYRSGWEKFNKQIYFDDFYLESKRVN